jgi:hypothetical protein
MIHHRRHSQLGNVERESYLNPACIWRFVSTLVTVVVLLRAPMPHCAFCRYSKTYNTMEDHFNTAPIAAISFSLPYWAWQALPLTCAETLQKVAGDRIPGDYLQRVHDYESGKDGKPEARRRELSREGYEAFGFIYEKGADGQIRDLPVGTTQRHSFGLDRVWINCAVCHTGTVRKDAQDPGMLVLGMPGNQFNLYAFEQFVFHARSENFNLLNISFRKSRLWRKLDTVDHYIVYPIALTLTRDMILYLDNLVGFSVRQPQWGPGRTDTFTPAKNYAGDNWRRTMPDYFHTGKVGSDTLGTADLPSIWLQGPRKMRSDGRQMELHWDGNNDTVEERNLMPRWLPAACRRSSTISRSSA